MSHPRCHRMPLRTAIAAALFATLALAGCKKKDEAAMTPPQASEPAATTPAPMPTEPMPAPTAMTVSTVDLGNAIGPDNRIAMPSTSFARTDTIHASVASDGAGGNLTAKWTMGDQVVNTQDKLVPAGPQVTEFSISKPAGWPPGHHKLQLLMGGNAVQMREFDVK
jgi:hypothetical protein